MPMKLRLARPHGRGEFGGLVLGSMVGLGVDSGRDATALLDRISQPTQTPFGREFFHILLAWQYGSIRFPEETERR